MISKSKDSRKLRDEAMSRIEHVSMVASYRQKLSIVSRVYCSIDGNECIV